MTLYEVGVMVASGVGAYLGQRHAAAQLRKELVPLAGRLESIEARCNEPPPKCEARRLVAVHGG